MDSFIWILNSPKLTKHSIDECTKWVNSIVTADVPDAINEPVLFEFVKTYQIHHYPKTCRKYKNEKCSFRFGKYFPSCTIIAQLLEFYIPQDVRHEKMQRRNATLKKVKNYIDDDLNSSKKNFLDNTKDDYVEMRSIDEILAFLEISKQDYEEVLSILGDNDFQINYKRLPN